MALIAIWLCSRVLLVIPVTGSYKRNIKCYTDGEEIDNDLLQYFFSFSSFLQFFMAYYQNSSSGYDSHHPSPIPPHSPQYNNHDYYNNSYAMQHMPAYDDGHYHDGPMVATDDGYGVKKQNNGYQHLNDGPVLYTEYKEERQSCCDKVCCGCCTCFPRWLRWLCCILFFIIVALAIVVGVLAALFKVPEVEFKGIQGDPTFSLSGTSANISFTFDISVNNQNVEGITFDKIVANVR